MSVSTRVRPSWRVQPFRDHLSPNTDIHNEDITSDQWRTLREVEIALWAVEDETDSSDPPRLIHDVVVFYGGTACSFPLVNWVEAALFEKKPPSLDATEALAELIKQLSDLMVRKTRKTP